MTANPLIIGHRGASLEAPENTLAAFRMAIEAGADGVEFDVRLAGDGVPVVIHDPTLARTALRPEMVRELTSRQLGKVDIGSWFNLKFRKQAQTAFADQRVPTLSDVLSMLKGFAGLIYIELKAGDSDFRELAAAVCACLRDSPLLGQAIVKSFKLAAIPEVRHHLPGVQTAALFAPQILDYLRRRKYIVALAHEFGANQISLHRSLVTRGLAKRAAEAGMPVTVWTADNPKWIRHCRNLGIKALITNDPAKLLAARDRDR